MLDLIANYIVLEKLVKAPDKIFWKNYHETVDAELIDLGWTIDLNKNQEKHLENKIEKVRRAIKNWKQPSQKFEENEKK